MVQDLHICICICKKFQSFSTTDKILQWILWASSNQLCLSDPVFLMYIVLLLLHPSVGLPSGCFSSCSIQISCHTHLKFVHLLVQFKKIQIELFPAQNSSLQKMIWQKFSLKFSIAMQAIEQLHPTISLHLLCSPHLVPFNFWLFFQKGMNDCQDLDQETKCGVLSWQLWETGLSLVEGRRMVVMVWRGEYRW